MATVSHSRTDGQTESLAASRDPSAVLLDMASGWVLPGDDEAEGCEGAFLAEADCQRALKTSHRWALENQPL